RRNLDDAFDPGPDFPDPRLLSRAMAAVDSADRAHPRQPSRGRRQPRSLSELIFLNPSGPSGRPFAAVLIVLVLLAAVGTFVFIQHFVLSPTPAWWSGCGGSFECASVRGPLDYSHPGAGSIEIATVRNAATHPSHPIR